VSITRLQCQAGQARQVLTAAAGKGVGGFILRMLIHRLHLVTSAAGRISCSVVLLVTLAVSARATDRASALEAGFQRPPDSARPWVYSFWLNGNVTSNGITADLEAMRQAGIGGLLLMDVDQGTPKGPFAFATPEWRDLFKHLCAEAHRLGLEVNMNNDPGWCGSGGPWVTPELSMQKVVWTETQVKGACRFDGTLPRPEAFQDYYRDIAVVAFPTLDGDQVKMEDFSPQFTTSDGVSNAAVDARVLLDGDPKTKVSLRQPSPGKPSWLKIEFAQPFTARQMVLDMGLTGDQMSHGLLESSADGVAFSTVREFDAEDSILHLDFPAVTARYFRLLFPIRSPDFEELTIADMELSPRARIERVDAKAMFVRAFQYPGPNEFPGRAKYPQVAAGLTVERSRIVDLSDRLGRDGRLDWDAPAGSWTVLRIGHTSNGTDNHPAPEGGHGLECDKLSKAGVQVVFEGFIQKLVGDVKELASAALVSTHVDSWEVGSQNWTANFREEFRKRRGYDLLPFLPVMTGRVVDNLEISERFLWDLRQTVSDLLVENYAGHLHEMARQYGLRLSIEAYDGNPCVDLEYASQADEPMAEFWILPAYEMDYSCGEMASAAHVYGKPIVGAEAFTATQAEKWLWYPYTVKGYGDWAFCEGINRFVIHRYAFQPWTNPERAPGMSMGPFGLHYERTETWWTQSKAWHEYLARCQYLLQQGQFVADICYLAPETSPLHWKAPLESRERVGYSFDVCPASALVSRMSVGRGKLTLPDGMSYRLLVLPGLETITPPVLGKIKGLVQAGATVIGPKPMKSPSLSGYPDCDAEVSRVANELWGDGDGKGPLEHKLGKGRIICGKTPQQVLAESGVPPDFEPTTVSGRKNLRYGHRTLPGAEVYFVANRSSRAVDSLCVFRVAGRRPEFWWPDTGRLERLAAYDSAGGTISVPLWLEPFGSVFVVFRSDAKAEADRVTSIRQNGQVLLDLKFGPVRQAKAEVTADAADGADDASGSSGEIRIVMHDGHSASVSVRSKSGLPGSAVDGTNTFTIAVWAKPDIDIELPPESNFGKAAYWAERNEALYPPAGHEVYRNPEHAGAGLSIGRNGVCVFEHTADYFAPVLVFAAPLTNWTHVAVVYQDGKPRLYLNGILVHEGEQSTFIVHSGVGVQHRRRAAPFRGALGEFFNAQQALDGGEIARLVNSMPIPGLSPPPAISLRRSAAGFLQAELWQPGNYVAETAYGKRWRANVKALPAPVEITGSWDLNFPPHWGAPERVRLDHLISWSDHDDDGVKHFSGTATYGKTFSVPEGWLGADQRVYLDLGKVAVMAQVRVNDKDLGTLWKPPFRVDVTEALRPKDNLLEVDVVNLWVNRMIGDEGLPEDSERNPNSTLKQWPDWLQKGQPSPTGRYTFTTWRLWKQGAPLRESGLLGPVKLIATRLVTLKGAGRQD